MSFDRKDWFAVENVEEIPSPALLLYPDRIEENVRRMIGLAGGPAQLRPHLKTHKLAEITRMQMARGISKFKTATVAESEMAASCGAPDVLLAYQPVGPNVARLVELVRRFPKTRFSTVVDDAHACQRLSQAFTEAQLTLSVLLDIDCGMHRTGVAPSDAAVALYGQISKSTGLRNGGLHAYDGHIHHADAEERAKHCEEAFELVRQMQKRLLQAGFQVPKIVAGGTPTFPFHAGRAGVECSPGTCVLWDAGYGTKLPELDFLPAAVVLTRVTSKTRAGHLCLDLGHKAIASENPHPRVHLLGLTDGKAVTHSEEHLVIETAHAGRYAVGDCIYGIPWHICPTVALYSEGFVVKGGRTAERWQITARQRSLTV